MNHNNTINKDHLLDEILFLIVKNVSLNFYSEMQEVIAT